MSSHASNASPPPGPPSTPNRRIIGVSTKMYFSAARTTSYASSLLSLLSAPLGPSSSLSSSSSSSSSSPPNNPNLLTFLTQKAATTTPIDIFLLPDFVTLPAVISCFSSSPYFSSSAPAPAPSPSSSPPPPPPVRLLAGAQSCAAHAGFGAHSGEVSAAVLREVGASLVMVGHAERRRAHGETDAVVRDKAAAVASNGMWPLVCVGEEEVDEEGGVEAAAEEVLRQVRAALRGLPDEAEVVLAYEPVWAIGAPAPAGVEHVRGVVRRVRESEVVKGRKAPTRIVYGGAARPGLWKEGLEGEVDGLFLGRFAHEPEQFVRMICEVAGVEWDDLKGKSG